MEVVYGLFSKCFDGEDEEVNGDGNPNETG